MCLPFSFNFQLFYCFPQAREVSKNLPGNRGFVVIEYGPVAIHADPVDEFALQFLIKFLWIFIICSTFDIDNLCFHYLITQHLFVVNHYSLLQWNSIYISLLLNHYWIWTMIWNAVIIKNDHRKKSSIGSKSKAIRGNVSTKKFTRT